MKRISRRMGFKIMAATGFLISAVLCIYGWHSGILTSGDRLQSFIAGFGFSGIFIFILFQAAQVVFPILPGGIGCLVGVLLFGAWRGFLYNYLGICMGSVLAFIIAKSYGKAILHRLFSEKLIDRYERWTSEEGRFAKLFAVAIFLPLAPDDFLCYLAGTTEMPLSKFTIIILLGKPLAIALYSMGLMAVFTRVTALIGG